MTRVNPKKHPFTPNSPREDLTYSDDKVSYVSTQKQKEPNMPLPSLPISPIRLISMILAHGALRMHKNKASADATLWLFPPALPIALTDRIRCSSLTSEFRTLVGSNLLDCSSTD